jgi:hypothetical protein
MVRQAHHERKPRLGTVGRNPRSGFRHTRTQVPRIFKSAIGGFTGGGSALQKRGQLPLMVRQAHHKRTSHRGTVGRNPRSGFRRTRTQVPRIQIRDRRIHRRWIRPTKAKPASDHGSTSSPRTEESHRRTAGRNPRSGFRRTRTQVPRIQIRDRRIHLRWIRPTKARPASAHGSTSSPQTKVPSRNRRAEPAQRFPPHARAVFRDRRMPDRRIHLRWIRPTTADLPQPHQLQPARPHAGSFRLPSLAGNRETRSGAAP